MAGISELDSLAAKKRALVAESEVYRQTLRLELQNVRLYAARMQRRVDLLRSAKPLLALVPIIGAFAGLRFRAKRAGRPRGLRRWMRAALVGWRVYRNVAPVLKAVGLPPDSGFHSAPRS